MELTLTQPGTAPQDLAPDEIPSPKKVTRPRFAHSEPMPGEVSFKKERAEKPEPVAEPVVMAPDEESEQTALVKVERKPATGVVPIELDYSNYTPPQYRRVDPNINLRSVQAEAVDEFFATKLRRVIIALPTGCIDGEAMIQVNRAGKGFKTTLAHLFYKFNGGASEHGKTWDPNIKTYVKALVAGDLRLHEIDAVLDQGVKECVELLLESGKKLILTPDHEVCTGVVNGQQCYRRTDSLTVGDVVLSNGTAVCGTCRSTKNVVTRPSAKFRGHCHDCIHGQLTHRHSAGKGVMIKGYKYITCGMRYHPNKFKAGKRWLVAEHRLVAEAKLNGLSLDKWLEIIRTNSFGSEHKFLSRSVDVHHENEIKTDNDVENLTPKTSVIHRIEHGRSSGFRNMNGGTGGRGGAVQFVPKTDRVVSIRPVGKRHVYDIRCKDPWRNFVANGVVVHNCGKTVAGLAIAGRIDGRVLWIAHRDELIEQPAKEIEALFPGLEFGVEKGGVSTGAGRRVVIASIQTLQRKDRLTRIMSGAPISVVIYDECHHVTSASAVKVLTQLGCLREDGKGPSLLGLTATIERSDKVSLGTVFEDVIYRCSIQKAIELGFLVPPKPIKVPLAIDKAALRSVNGDFDLNDMDREMTRLGTAQATATAIMANCGTRKTIAFCTSINQAQRTAEACNKLGIKAKWVSGLGRKNAQGVVNGMSKGERKRVLKDFTSGKIQVLTCADLLCLDQETEILTREGWVGIDEMTPEHQVANWDAGRVFFAPPKAIYRRQREPGERMVSLGSKYCSVRVTDRHSLVWRTRGAVGWRKEEAAKIAATKSDSTIELPVSGVAVPESFTLEHETPKVERMRRLVSAAAFNLRNRENYGWANSFAEANRRVTRRHSQLRQKSPHELTQDECMLIGMWLADGSVNRLSSGGLEYTICQGVDWPLLVKWVEERLQACGIDYRKRLNTDRNAFVFSMPRGTGGGSQQRNGVFAIEPYLDKRGTEMLWGLSERQFEALMFGFWVGDGSHGKGDTKPEGFMVSNADPVLMSELQAIAACRGFKTSLRRVKNGRSKVDGRALYTHKLRWRKTISHAVAGAVNPLRSAQSKKLIVEEDWKAERVWCVKSESGNIMTRRRGTVVVLGNCEGYDEKSIGAVVIARPTKSQGRYIQQAGRGLRTCEHKTDCVLIDITSSSDLGLVGADILLKKPIDKKPKKKRTGPAPIDSNTEWKKLQSYLRSARVDILEHGELTFARASKDLVATVAKDRELVIVRRVAQDDSDQWVIEHGGVVYTPEPLTFIGALSVCDVLLPSFGGGAKPGSEEWNAAAEKPTPPPASQPGGGPAFEPTTSDPKVETTTISEPEGRLPLAMNFTGGSDISDLAEQVTHDLLNTNAAAFARGLRRAFQNSKCHLMGMNKSPPDEPERWGWAKSGGNWRPAGFGNAMIGWVYGDTAFVDPDVGVKLAQEQLATGKDPHEIKLKHLRKHLGTVHRLFKGEKKDWLKVRAVDIDPLTPEREATS